MTYRMSLSYRLGEFLIYTGIIIFLLLLVVVPVQSQNPIPTQPGPPEANQPLYQDAPKELLLFLMLQFVFLLIVVVSYLVDPKRLQRAGAHEPGRWYGHLHLPY